jgi:hypothetical protein
MATVRDRVQQQAQRHDQVHERLREQYPEWHIWRSRNGSNQLMDWYATRGEALTAEEERQGFARTLVAGTPEGLREQLDAQIGAVR